MKRVRVYTKGTRIIMYIHNGIRMISHDVFYVFIHEYIPDYEYI